MDIFVSLNSMILLFTLAVNIGLSIFIYFKDRKNIVNISFAALLFSTALWTLSLLLFLHARSPQEALWIRRLTPIGSGFVIGFLAYFSLVFPRAEKIPSTLQKALIVLPPAIFSVASIFTNLMIKGILFTKGQPLYFGQPIFGGLYRIYSVYILGFFILAVFNLMRRYLKSEGREKLQIWYVMFGVGLTGIHHYGYNHPV